MKLTYISIFLCLFFALSGCHKKSEYLVYFFQNVDETRQYHLVLDNRNKGEVPFLNEDANCESSSVQSNSLILVLEEGSYKYQLLNSAEEVVSEGKFKISSRKVSSSGGKGSVMLQVGGQKAAIRLGE